MNVSERRSAFEAKLAAAHRMAYYAAQQADALGYRGAEQQLHTVMATLTELMQDSVSSNPSALRSLRTMRDNVPF